MPEIEPAGPKHIWIEPTKRCNTRCRHCGHYYASFGEDMPGEVYERARDAVLDDAEFVELLGYGEPLIASQFERMFDDCARRGIPTSTTTNGIALRSDALLRKIVRNDMLLSLSVDGARPETFEFVRPHIKFQRMLEILERIRRFGEEAGEKKRFQLQLVFVPMKRNIGDLPDVVRLAARYGARSIEILPLAFEEGFPEVEGQSLRDSPEELAAPFSEALRLSAHLGVEIHVPASFRNLIVEGTRDASGLGSSIRDASRKGRLILNYIRRKGFRRVLETLFWGFGPTAKTGVSWCAAPWTATHFNAEGKVLACCGALESLGDIRTQSWDEVWNGWRYRSLRRTIHGWNPTRSCRCCPLPMGIHGGDNRRHEKLFGQFQVHRVALDDPDVQFGEGFTELEPGDSGPAGYIWMGRRALLTLPNRQEAKFLRLLIIPGTPPHFGFNAGSCRVNGGEAEPFDNTCSEIVFPLAPVRGARLDVEIEMETTFRVGDDPRDLGLAVAGIQFLY